MSRFLSALLIASWVLLPRSLAAEDGARQVSIAVAQPLVTPGDVAANIRAMEPLVAEAARRGAVLVLFSECGVTGYDLGGVGAAAAVQLGDPALEEVAALARKHRTAVVAGLSERSGAMLFNTVVAFLPDGRRVVQRKHNILEPERAVAPVAAAPRERVLFEVAGLTFGILICSDNGMAGIYEELATAGCDVVLLPTAGAGSDRMGFHQSELEDPQRRAEYLEVAASCISQESIERCLASNVCVAACNQSGWNPAIGYFHPGGSSIIDRTGAVAAVIPPRFVFQHLRPELAVGIVSAKTRTASR